MAALQAFIFVDSSPARTDTRYRELIRAQALSHAAKASHRAKRQAAPTCRSKPENFFSVRMSQGSASQRQEAAPAPKTKVSDNAEQDSSTHPSRKQRGRSDIVQRRRLRSEKASRRHSHGGTHTDSLSRRPDSRCSESPQIILPIYKGNSDPFNCTAVPFTALDLFLVKDDRRSLVDIVWPAEIAMRKNHPALLGRMWNGMPSVLDCPAVVHAIISHAHYSKVLRRLASGQSDHNATILAEHHKLRAVRNLQRLLEAYSRSGGLDLLTQIRGASTQLAACGVISGDAGSAQIHFAGVKKAIDLMGGLRNMRPTQSECLVFSQVASAWFNRSRPVFDPDEWDPGLWAEQKLVVCGLLRSISGGSASPLGRPCSSPSAVSPDMKLIIERVRELLYVEDVKLALASSREDEMATQVFRWSGLRKLAVRARNLCFWCDSNEAVKSAGAGVNMGSTASVSFDMIIAWQYAALTGPSSRNTTTLTLRHFG